MPQRLLILAAALLPTACGVSTTTRTWTIVQSADLLAPTGPAATGPMTSKGRWAAQAHVSRAVIRGDNARDDQSGHSYRSTLFGTTALLGLTRTQELSLSLDVASASSRTAAHLRAPMPDVGEALATRGAFGYRVLLAGTRRTGLVGTWGALLESWSFWRGVDLEETTSVTSVIPETGRVVESGFYTRAATASMLRRPRLWFSPVVGLQGNVAAGPNTDIAMGAHFRSMPHVRYRQVISETCTGTFLDTECSGSNPGSLAESTIVFHGSLFVRASRSFGPVAAFVEGVLSVPLPPGDVQSQVPLTLRSGLRWGG